MRRDPYRLTLAVIVLAAVALSITFVLLVPALQQPDELAHLDYAFALYDAGGPFRVPRAVPGTEVTRQAKYLADVSNYRIMRYNPFAREPPSYGTLAFWKRVDAAAPRPSHRVPRRGSRMPYVMFAYPIGYYALVATVMSLVDWLSHGSFTAIFFAARLVNVVFLAATLVLAAAIFRRLRVDRVTALYATAAIGLLPLTSWVCAYVQPDNLALLLLTAVTYVALLWIERPFSFRVSLVLSVIVGALFVTKLQYAIAAWLVVAILTGTRIRRSIPAARTVLCGAIMLVAPLSLYATLPRFTPVMQLSPAGILRTAPSTNHVGAIAYVSKLAALAITGFLDAYDGGSSFHGYWFAFGFRDGLIYPRALHVVALYILIIATMATLVVTLLLGIRTLRRIGRVARFRSPGSAARFVASDVALNIYLAVTAALLAARAATGGWLQLEGRYWLPVIVPATVILVVRIPKLAHTMGRRRLAARWIASVLAAYSVFSSAAAVLAMRANFYFPSHTATTYDIFSRVLQVRDADRSVNDLRGTLVLNGDRAIVVTGFAVDMRTGLPAANVQMLVDGGRYYNSRTRLPSIAISDVFHDDRLRDCGFALHLPARTIAPGMHRLTFRLFGDQTLSPLAFAAPLTIRIVTRRERS